MSSVRDLQPICPHLLPVGRFDGLPLAEVSAALGGTGWKILPTVPRTDLLEQALKAYPITVVIAAPNLAESERDSSRELAFAYAAGWCDLSAKSGSAGDIVGLVLQTQQERRSRVESRFLTSFLKLLPDAAFFKDRCGRFLAANPKIAEHFGVHDPALLLGRSDFDFFSIEHAQPASLDEQEVIRTGRPILGKLERETFIEDRVSWCLTWRAPLRDEQDRIIGTFGLARDVTALKNTESALATERHLLEALLTSMPDSVFIKDTQGRFLLANKVVAGWLGTTPEAMRGKTDADFFTPEQMAAYKQDEDSVLTSGMPVINREEKVHTADGRELWVLTTKVPFRDHKDNLAGIIGMSRNITHRRDFQQQLNEAQQEIVRLRREIARLQESPAAAPDSAPPA
jgi:PAS domain S-box-containing protein